MQDMVEYFRLPAAAAALTLLLGIGASSDATAADSKGQFALRGAGLATCEQFVKALEERGNDMFAIGGWLDGYLTALNQYVPQTFDVAPWQSTDSMANIILRNCRQDPQQRFIAVVSSMANAFKKTQLKELSNRKPIKVANAQTLVYDETVKRVQEALANTGHFTGKPDGQFGPATQAAIEAYQKASSIDMTGLPDQRTLWGLLGPALSQGAQSQGQEQKPATQSQEQKPAPQDQQGQPRRRLKTN
ncbi:MAG: peptidoglycan-binding protein [Alphaproteobacteria bacterium]|nr:peptidoglycan-binding protein [Alphaproteobacteria bacterium]